MAEPSEISKRKSRGNIYDHLSKPTIVTDWRTEVFGETHQGSFIWEDLDIMDEKSGLCRCTPRSFGCRGKKAILTGSRLILPKMTSLIEYFDQRLGKHKIHPNREAVNFGIRERETLTFNELNLVSNGLGNLLLSKLGPDCKNNNLDNDIIVAVCCHPSVQYVCLVLAIMKMGAGIFPISMDSPNEKIFNSLNEVRPILIVVSRESDLLKALQKSKSKLLDDYSYAVLEDIWADLDDARTSSTEPVPYIKKLQSEPDRVYPPLHRRTVAIISPSNAYGTFNGIRYKSQSIFNWLLWEWRYFSLEEKEKIILQSEMDTVPALLEILSPLLHGNCLVVLNQHENKHPLILLQKIEKFQILRISVWPSLMRSILNTVELIDIEIGKNLLSTVKYWFCIGGVLNIDEANLFFSVLSKGHRMLINMYENDENVGVVCYQILDSPQHVERLNHQCRLPIGYPIPNLKIYVVDENMKIVRGSETGEICVAVSEEYSTTQGRINKFILNPFSNSVEFKFLLKTGDYGSIKSAYGRRHLVYENSPKGSERRVFIDSRIVELDEIQNNIKSLKDLVIDCHVMCHRPGHEDQNVVAFCCVEDTRLLDKHKIRSALRTKIPGYMIPDIIELDEIPRDENGVVNENYLQRCYYDESIRRQDFDDWNSMGPLSPSQLHAVKVLFKVIFLMLGTSIKDIAANYNKPFFSDRKASVSKLVFIVYELHRNRYPINLAEFLKAESLADIIVQMVISKDMRGLLASDHDILTIEKAFRVDILKEESKHDVLDLLSLTLTDKGRLDFYTDVQKWEIRRLISIMWELFVAKGLSKVVRRITDNKIVGVALNINWHDEIEKSKGNPLTRKIAYRLQLSQILENGFAQTNMSPTESSVLQICYAILDTRLLNHIETHRLMEKMIAATIETATELSFDAIVFITYDFFVTDICVANFDFKVIRECKLNQFIASDSTKPYHEAPDSKVASMCWRRV